MPFPQGEHPAQELGPWQPARARHGGRATRAASEQTCVVKLVGRDAVVDKLVYAATNPVLDDLVDRVHHWPGGVP